jgi:hypothetical protein
MRTSEDSRREQAARFIAMAQEARDEGKPGLADLLSEAACRSIAAEALPPTDDHQVPGPTQQQQENEPAL